MYSIHVSTVLLFIFLISVKCTICLSVEDFMKIDSSRGKRDVEDVSNIWMEYEFNTGAGNRDELIVTDVSVHEYVDLPKTETKWQYLNVNGSNYLFRAEESTLYFYEVDLNNVCISYSSSFDAGGNITSYRVITLRPGINLIVLCVESKNATSLRWYKLEGKNVFEHFWSWPVLKRIKDIQFIRNRKSYQLLLLNDEEIHFGAQYSAIDVYGFYINLQTSIKYFWLYDEISKLRTSSIQVCPTQGISSLAIQGSNHVLFYEDRNVTEGSSFRELQTIKSHNLSNFVCFESGYLPFLAISGPEAGLFQFVNGEFQFNAESESNFDVSEITWVESIRADTYREEFLLLLQMKNSTVLALSWQGLSFKRTKLPNKNLDQFDLSKIIPIPQHGFIQGNKYVKIHTQLKDLKHPIQYSTERLFILQRLLNDTLNRQDRIINETEARIERSYFKNPVTGFWNISAANVTNATLSSNVTFNSITVGSVDLTPEDLLFDLDDFEKRLKSVEQKLVEIDSNVAKANELDFDSDVEIFGDINFAGSLTVENLTARFINDVSMNDSLSHDDYTTTEQTFDFIEAENLTIRSVNDIPVENIFFSDVIKDYRRVDFSRINKAEVKGSISFSTINGIDWNILMRHIVWKDEAKIIPGNTIIEGTLATDTFDINRINNLKYPEDFVLAHGSGETIVTGSKSFGTLITPRLENVNTLNGLNFDEYVVLQKNNVLKTISFENLTIDEELRVDCEIEGFNQTDHLFLNETNKISSDVTFMNLTISGNVTFDTIIMNKKLLNFDDLLLKTEENVEITGTKTFLGKVEMKSNVTITSGMINGHLIEEFVTYDTEQTFPNLNKILANVTFGNVTFGAIEKLEAFFDENKNADNCLEKALIFKYPITVDELSFDTINENISYEEFNRKLNETLRNVVFEDLIVDNITANEIVPKTINDVDFGSLVKNLSSCNIVDEQIGHLETDYLNATYINGMSVDEIVQLVDKLDEILNNIRNGSTRLETIQVTGLIKTNSINGIPVKDLYNDSNIDTIIFEENVSIKNLTVLSFMNGFNFSERVADTILNNDIDIVLEGHKVFESNVSCYELVVNSINNRPIGNILDPSKEQTLSGPVIINGSITVSNGFNVTGRINNISFHDFTNRFNPVGNNTYEFRDGINFLENVTIQDIRTTGLIEGKNFTKFLDTVVYKDKDDVTISGTKIFKSNVVFNNSFIIRDNLNDMDLRRFYEKAVFIDKPFSVKSKIIFKGTLRVEKDIIVKTNLEAKSIMGIDLDDLKRNVMNVNRPTYIDGSITFSKVDFLSNIKVDLINDIDMKLLLPLKTEQTIPVEVLRCRNITVEKVQIFGRINNENLKQIQENTFMLTGDQNVTGNFNFYGHVVAPDFNARLINGIDPARFIPLNTKNPIIGNFVFERPVLFNQSLRVFGYLNGINPSRWEAVAVTANNSFKQIISGRWTVYGNVYFENGAEGSDMLNGTNVTELSNALGKKHLEMNTVLAETKANLHSVCEDLNHLKHYAERQIYQFNVFDYLQVIEYNSSIVSSHYFELDDLDYLILSYDDCQMHMYQYTGERFELVASIPDFGVIEKWSTFERDQTLYFLTLGRNSCGRSSVNLWKLKDDDFEFVLNLGHKINRRDINQDIFVTMIAEIERLQSSEVMNEEFEKSLSSLAGDNLKLHVGDELLKSVNEAYEHDVESYDTSVGKYFGKPEVLKFKAGFLEKEMYLYYDEELSRNRIFICSNDEKRDKILQTIIAHRPTSFVVFSFEGSFETLLIFMENRKILKIYEYKGIQGFVYRDGIKINANKLFSFKIRKYVNFAKRRCLGLVDDKKLSILEAEMYGEKLDIGTLTCSKNSSTFAEIKSRM